MQLNPAQQKAIAHKSGPCMVLAGPGSGKTTVIIKRIQNLIQKHKVNPNEILVITFSKASANEMRTRFQEACGSTQGVTFGTFHGIYYGILKWAYHLTTENIMSEEEKYQILQRVLEQCMIDGEDEKEFLRGIAEEIGVVKNNQIPLNEYHSLNCDEKEFQNVYRMYEAERNRLKKIDFDDMLVLTYELFKERKDILSGWQEKYRYILIDEFQDINRVQYEVIRMLAAPEDNLFIVGDDDQSIYRFRGAVPEIMLNFPKDYPDVKQIVLDVNYRSTKAIVHVAERVIRNNQKRYQKAMITGNPQGKNVHVQETKNPLDESRYVVKEIRRAIERGVPLTELAVLYRTNQEARSLVETCLEYGVSFRLNEQVPNLYDHFIAKDILAYMKCAMGDMSRQNFLRIANRPNRYIARENIDQRQMSFEYLKKCYEKKEWMLERVEQMELDMRVLNKCAPYAAIQYLRKHVGYNEFLKEYSHKRRMRIEDFLEVLYEIEERAKEFSTMQEWFAYIEEFKRTESSRKTMQTNDREGILLATMHSSKGLEFQEVYIIGVNEGVLPYKKAEMMEEIEEERRLFYVAMTRAKKRLCVSYVKERNGKKAEISRFLLEVLKM